MKFETKTIHGGFTTDLLTGSVNTPIYQTATFKQSSLGVNSGYEYARTKNPTRSALESLIRDLEEGDEGFAFSSGMAAITTLLSLFSQGDRILISDNLYGGTYRVIDKVFKRFGIDYTMIDTSNLSNVEKSFTTTYKAVFIESPTNPLLGISDIAGIARIAKLHHSLLIVDNTFMTPYLQKPLLLGADIVIHSGTKYLGGHSDLIAGLVVTKTGELSAKISFLQNAMGAILGPQDSFLLIRGIKTLAMRMDRHLENTEKILEFLLKYPTVVKIYHPSLPDHPNHDIAYTQSKGSVGMISFVLDNSIHINTFLSSLETISLAESLGGIESLISHPATMTHASYPTEYRVSIGIVDQLIRLSVGCEHYFDLIDDLTQAFAKAAV